MLYCKRCGEKIGFFEKVYEGMHYKCHIQTKKENVNNIKYKIRKYMYFFPELPLSFAYGFCKIKETLNSLLIDITFQDMSTDIFEYLTEFENCNIHKIHISKLKLCISEIIEKYYEYDSSEINLIYEPFLEYLQTTYYSYISLALSENYYEDFSKIVSSHLNTKTPELNVLSLYITNLFAFSQVHNFFNYTILFKENKDFYRILSTNLAQNTNADYNLIYKIYLEFYSNILEVKLSYEEFALVIEIFKELEDINNKNDSSEDIAIINKKLYSKSLDTNELIKNLILEENPKIITHYIAHLVEQRNFDILFSDVDASSYVARFICSINYSLINILDLEHWINELLNSIEMITKIWLCAEKYKLLNPTLNATPKNIRTNLEQAITGEDFEIVLKMMYEAMGFDVQTTPKTNDQGADLILQKSGIKSIVQAKFYSHPVGNTAIQEVVAALKFYNAQKGIVVTNSTFTHSAIELAKANNIQLINGDELRTLINIL